MNENQVANKENKWNPRLKVCSELTTAVEEVEHDASKAIRSVDISIESQCVWKIEYE